MLKAFWLRGLLIVRFEDREVEIEVSLSELSRAVRYLAEYAERNRLEFRWIG